MGQQCSNGACNNQEIIDELQLSRSIPSLAQAYEKQVQQTDSSTNSQSEFQCQQAEDEEEEGHQKWYNLIVQQQEMLRISQSQQQVLIEKIQQLENQLNQRNRELEAANNQGNQQQSADEQQFDTNTSEVKLELQANPGAEFLQEEFAKITESLVETKKANIMELRLHSEYSDTIVLFDNEKPAGSLVTNELDASIVQEAKGNDPADQSKDYIQVVIE